SVAFSPDGSLAATAGGGYTARLWRTTTGEPVGTPLQHQSHSVRTMVFSPDGRTLYTGDFDGNFRRWDVAMHAPLEPPLPPHGLVASLSCSPDGKTLLTGTYAGA